MFDKSLPMFDKHSGRGLSLPPSPYATLIDFARHVIKLMSNDLLLLHCSRSLSQNEDKLEE